MTNEINIDILRLCCNKTITEMSKILQIDEELINQQLNLLYSHGLVLKIPGSESEQFHLKDISLGIKLNSKSDKSMR